MALLRALVQIPKASGLPEDAVTNTWYFDGDPTVGSGDMEEIAAALTQFYNAIDTYLSPILGTTATVTFYSMSDPEPRPPLYTANIALVLSTGNPLPDEVALCLSFRGTYPAGAVRARRRGRLFIGPLGNNTQGTTTAANRPSSTFVSALATAADTLLTSSQTEPWDWVVYSPTSDSDTPVVAGWVDNAYDTQRRRGVAATSRTTFS